VSDDKHRELADCFAAEARDLFGYACILTRGNEALAGDLVQGAFEAGSRAWPVVRGLDEQQRCAWLRGTLVTAAVSGFRREATLPERLPHLQSCRRKDQAEPAEHAFPPDVLERCWRTIQDLPEWPHAVALLRWHLDMKEAEIAAAVDRAEQTVSADLDRARRRLIAQLEPDRRDADHPGDPGDGADRQDPGHPGDGADRQDPGHPGDDPDHDVLLSRLYQQVTDREEARFSTAYDLVAGLDRYQVWLRAERRADEAVYALYAEHYKSLVRLAAMLVRDTPTAEEVVQEAFVAMHAGWQRLEDTEKALAYLRQAVVNKSRSVLRHRVVVEKNLQNPPPDMPSAEHGAFALLERSAVIKALRGLPERQREAIVLRYYADLSEADIAATMGISRGAVKSHTARGMAALRAALQEDEED
jgi:RNA polymerase sigma-70 factor (sigma-E family)